jgi:hypothetical protein
MVEGTLRAFDIAPSEQYLALQYQLHLDIFLLCSDGAVQNALEQLVYMTSNGSASDRVNEVQRYRNAMERYVLNDLFHTCQICHVAIMASAVECTRVDLFTRGLVLGEGVDAAVSSVTHGPLMNSPSESHLGNNSVLIFSTTHPCGINALEFDEKILASQLNSSAGAVQSALLSSHHPNLTRLLHPLVDLHSWHLSHPGAVVRSLDTLRARIRLSTCPPRSRTSSSATRDSLLRRAVCASRHSTSTEEYCRQPIDNERVQYTDSMIEPNQAGERNVSLEAESSDLSLAHKLRDTEQQKKALTDVLPKMHEDWQLEMLDADQSRQLIQELLQQLRQRDAQIAELQSHLTGMPAHMQPPNSAAFNVVAPFASSLLGFPPSDGVDSVASASAAPVAHLFIDAADRPPYLLRKWSDFAARYNSRDGVGEASTVMTAVHIAIDTMSEYGSAYLTDVERAQLRRYSRTAHESGAAKSILHQASAPTAREEGLRTLTPLDTRVRLQLITPQRLCALVHRILDAAAKRWDAEHGGTTED